MSTTDLYRSVIEFEPSNEAATALAHEVWDGTPWMIDVYAGSFNEVRRYDILHWCHDTFGRQADPFGPDPRPGRWRQGNATVDGWTWFGFATEADMQQFIEHWPNPVQFPGTTPPVLAKET